MALELKQNLKLTQQLVMTPQLQQAIKLLQVSRLELVDAINQEMQENPLLEELTGEEYSVTETPAESDDLKTVEGEEIKLADHTEELTGEGDGKTEFDWDNYLEDYGTVGVTYDRSGEEGPAWDNFLTAQTSLTDHLMWQVKLSRMNESEMAVAEQIVGNLDTNGYLVATLEEIAAQSGTQPSFVEGVLRKVHDFDPPGVAARDLKECLLIQARVLRAGPLVQAIIRDHLKELEIKNYGQICRKLKTSAEDVEAAILVIMNMNPKPGALYNEEKAQPVIPDVFVFKAGDEYKIVLNDDGLPRLRISNFYREVMAGLSGSTNSEGSRRYIREKIQSATWLIKSIQQRQNTIYKVTESILRFQLDFFEQGVSFLKPLVLRDVADDVGMHESTISRVVSNKYVHTPRGIYLLKYFFSSGIHRTSGENIASKSVKEEIRKLVQAEDPRKPLSDQEIVQRLEAGGIAIARRTVAKYREMMGILPSSRRKRLIKTQKTD